MAQGYPEIEEQESTRVEKFLVFALVVFLLIGGFWVLGRMDEAIREPVLATNAYEQNRTGERSIDEELGIDVLQRQVEILDRAVQERQSELATLQSAADKRRKVYLFKREEYRTTMEAHRAAEPDRIAFVSARTELEIAEAKVKQATTPLAAAQNALKEPTARLAALRQRAQDIFDARSRTRSAMLFGAQFGFAAGCLGLSWFLWTAARRRRWRYLTIASAGFYASTLQLALLSFVYCWRVFLHDFATLGISVIGVVVCVLAVVGVKKWLYNPERLTLARLAGARCPQCAVPFRDGQKHCWGCGQALQEPCGHCGAERLSFVPYCSVCGKGSGSE